MALLETSSLSLALPPEIWRIVLHSFGTQPQDLVRLWTGCRGVSKHFKREVEELFIAGYLPYTSLIFDITTSQGFNRNSRIEFRNHQVETAYKAISVDRAGAFFHAEFDHEAKLLKQLHIGGGFSGPSHLVYLSRPSDDVASPGVFFHANGDVEVGWRELFAAVLAEEKFYCQTVSTPMPVTKGGLRALTSEKSLRGAEIYESKMNKAVQAEAPRARVFRIVIVQRWK